MAAKNRTVEVIICLGKCPETASDLLPLWHEKTPEMPGANIINLKKYI